MSGYFVFGDFDSRDHDLKVSGHKTFNSPARKINRYAVPGRSGDIVEDLDSFENIELVYENGFLYLPQDFDIEFDAVKSELLSKKGYQRLEDSYHPDEYRLAVFSKGITAEMNDRNDFAMFDLVFNAKPQRFLKYGEETTTYTSFTNQYISNPEYFDAFPLIRVYGNGTVGIGEYSFTTKNNADNYIDIDCNIMDCRREASNMNGDVTFTRHRFPVLKAKARSGITATSGISKIEITPRWYRL